MYHIYMRAASYHNPPMALGWRRVDRGSLPSPWYMRHVYTRRV